MGELGEIGKAPRAEIEQVLALQIAPRALARDRGHALARDAPAGSSRRRAAIAAHARR